MIIFGPLLTTFEVNSTFVVAGVVAKIEQIELSLLPQSVKRSSNACIKKFHYHTIFKNRDKMVLQSDL